MDKPTPIEFGKFSELMKKKGIYQDGCLCCGRRDFEIHNGAFSNLILDFQINPGTTTIETKGCFIITCTYCGFLAQHASHVVCREIGDD